MLGKEHWAEDLIVKKWGWGCLGNIREVEKSVRLEGLSPGMKGRIATLCGLSDDAVRL